MKSISSNTGINNVLVPHRFYYTQNNNIYHSNHNTFNSPDPSNPQLSGALNRIVCSINISRIQYLNTKRTTNELESEIRFYHNIKDGLCAYIHSHYSVHDTNSLINCITNDIHNGNTWLHKAIACNYGDILQYLINHGGQKYVNTKNDFSQTPLMLAIMSSHDNTDMVSTLIKAGADVNEPDSHGISPIEYALIFKDNQVLRLLLEAKANVNTSVRRDYSMLHAAVHRKNPEAVKMLLEACADKNIRNADGKTPLDDANASLNYEIMYLLNNSNIKCQASTNTVSTTESTTKAPSTIAQTHKTVTESTDLNHTNNYGTIDYNGTISSDDSQSTHDNTMVLNWSIMALVSGLTASMTYLLTFMYKYCKAPEAQPETPDIGSPTLVAVNRKQVKIHYSDSDSNSTDYTMVDVAGRKARYKKYDTSSDSTSGSDNQERMELITDGTAPLNQHVPDTTNTEHSFSDNPYVNQGYMSSFSSQDYVDINANTKVCVDGSPIYMNESDYDYPAPPKLVSAHDESTILGCNESQC